MKLAKLNRQGTRHKPCNSLCKYANTDYFICHDPSAVFSGGLKRSNRHQHIKAVLWFVLLSDLWQVQFEYLAVTELLACSQGHNTSGWAYTVVPCFFCICWALSLASAYSYRVCFRRRSRGLHRPKIFSPYPKQAPKETWCAQMNFKRHFSCTAPGLKKNTFFIDLLKPSVTEHDPTWPD